MRKIDPSNMKEAAQSACELLGAIASERRMIILCHLLSGESSVNDLCEKIGLNQATVSQQLAKLRALRLVETRREGKQIHYRLTSEEVERVLVTLYGIYCDPETMVRRRGVQ
jgi:ArsR family transcriptional regulator, virulence genes transcriptional regulator